MLAPTYSVLDSTTGYAASNSTTNPTFVAQYCNGSRVPPTCTAGDGCGGPNGYGVPPGIADATTPNPVFSLTPAATVDEGNNWINVSWGPMALTNDSATGGANGNYGGGINFANYTPTSGMINIVPQSNLPTATFMNLKYDYFGTARPTTGNVTAGAIEITGGGGGGGTSTFTVTPSTLAFGTEPANGTSASMAITVTNTGTTALAGGTFTFGGTPATPQPFSHPTQLGACGATLAVGASCTYNVVFHPATGTANGTSFTRTLTVAYTAATGTGTPVTLTGTVEPQGTLHFLSATNGTLSGATSGSTFTFTVATRGTPVQSVVTLTNAGPTGSSLTITGDSLLLGSGTFTINSTTCSASAPLASGATCTVTVTYNDPVTAPTLPNINTLDIANNGTGTIAGVSVLILSGR
jgi:hypothetical protein